MATYIRNPNIYTITLTGEYIWRQGREKKKMKHMMKTPPVAGSMSNPGKVAAFPLVKNGRVSCLVPCRNSLYSIFISLIVSRFSGEMCSFLLKKSLKLNLRAA